MLFILIILIKMRISQISIKNPQLKQSAVSSQQQARKNLKMVLIDTKILKNFSFNPSIINHSKKSIKSLTNRLNYMNIKSKPPHFSNNSIIFTQNNPPSKKTSITKEGPTLVSKRQSILKSCELSSERQLKVVNSSKWGSELVNQSIAGSWDQFYKRDRQEQGYSGGGSNEMSFTQRFASIEVQQRTLTYQMRKMKRIRDKAEINRKPLVSRHTRTEYYQEDRDHNDSFIFRRLIGSAKSQGKVEVKKIQLKKQEFKVQIELETLDIDNILIPRYVCTGNKAKQDLESSKRGQTQYPLSKKSISAEEVLGIKQHPYVCILKLPQRLEYKKFNSICRDTIKPTKRH